MLDRRTGGRVKAAGTEHLSPAMRRFYNVIARKYALQEQHRRLLITACEAHDRMTQAREQLAREGLTITTRHGEVRQHPCAAIERDSATRFARLLRELGLADEPENPRPPRLAGRYSGRR
jgi:P27 family predicted phage terminase small subunit